MNFTDLQTELFLKERNIYEAADLYEQNRLTVAEMSDLQELIAAFGSEHGVTFKAAA